jgi:glutamate synthase domain-containing protein 3
VLVLGDVGRNFAAGMSGGIAYVVDSAGTLARRVHPGMVTLEPLDRDDGRRVRSLLRRHVAATDSVRAATLLARWRTARRTLVKVMPRDYARVLKARARAAREGRQVRFEELVDGVHG